MERQTKNLTIILTALIIAVVGLTVSYAALSTNLKVTFSNLTQNAATWKVAFTPESGSVTATAGGTSATGRTCGAATLSATTVTIADTTLSKPGDSCTYTLKIKNGGSINAKLGTITTTKPTSTQCTGDQTGKLVCGNITYDLQKSGGTTLAVNETLNASAALDLKLVVSYTGTTVNAEQVNQPGAAFTLVWNQN